MNLCRNIPVQVQTLKTGSTCSHGYVIVIPWQLNLTGKFPMIGANIEISKICVRDLSKPRDFTCSSDTKFVTDYNDILVCM